MRLNWYDFIVKRNKIAKIIFLSPAAAHRVRGETDRSFAIVAYDELDAFLLITKWLEQGKPEFVKIEGSTEAQQGD